MLIMASPLFRELVVSENSGDRRTLSAHRCRAYPKRDSSTRLRIAGSRPDSSSVRPRTTGIRSASRFFSWIGSELFAAWGDMIVIDRRRFRSGVRFVARDHCADAVTARTEAHAIGVEHPLLRSAAARPHATACLAQIVGADLAWELKDCHFCSVADVRAGQISTGVCHTVMVGSFACGPWLACCTRSCARTLITLPQKQQV